VSHRAHTPDRRVEELEQLVGDPCRNLGAKAAGELILRARRRPGSCAARAATRPAQSKGNNCPQVEHCRADPFLSQPAAPPAETACTSAPHVMTVRSSPSRRSDAFPNGIMKSAPGYSPLLLCLAVEMFVLEKEYGGHRTGWRSAADRTRQRAFEGKAIRMPGSARRCSRPIGCDTARLPSGTRQSARG